MEDVQTLERPIQDLQNLVLEDCRAEYILPDHLKNIGVDTNYNSALNPSQAAVVL